MATVKLIRLGWHKASKQFTKWVGKSWGQDGKMKPYCFYLGTDESVALAHALDLQKKWGELTRNGQTTWPVEFLRKFNGQNRTNATAPLTIAQAKEKYFASMTDRANAQQISHRHVAGETFRLNKACEFLDTTHHLVAFGEKELTAVVLQICKRPREWSALYSVQILKAFKWFLNWCHEHDLWTKPRQYDRIFKQLRPQMTLPEKHDKLTGEAPYLTVEELTALYKACETDLEKAIVLLGVNCGFCQSETSTLRRCEFKGASIERLRPKTDVYAKWHLWSETSAVLEAALAPANEWDVALLYCGHPLFIHNPMTNSLRFLWDHIRQRSKVNKPYKLLRKTGARMIKMIGGLEVSEMFLAHAEGGINHHYSGRDWGKLEQALTAMREQLEPMFKREGETGLGQNAH